MIACDCEVENEFNFLTQMRTTRTKSRCLMFNFVHVVNYEIVKDIRKKISGHDFQRRISCKTDIY